MKWLANYFAFQLVNGHNNRRQLEIVSYGLEIIFNLSCQFFLMLLIGYVLNCVSIIIVATLSAVVLRSLSGGSHCSNFYRCTFISCSVFTSIGYFADKIFFNTETVVAIYIIMIVLMLLWAPASKRRWSNKKKLFFKVSSAIYIFALLFLSLGLNFENVLVKALMLGLCWQVFTVTPIGFLAISKIDYYLSFGKEVGTEHA